jgi:hypothetical protein
MAASTARPSGHKSLVTVIRECALKPITKKNILFHYSPLVGVVSYSFLSLNVMNPGLVVRYVNQPFGHPIVSRYPSRCDYCLKMYCLSHFF